MRALFDKLRSRVSLSTWVCLGLLAVYLFRYFHLESVQAHGDSHYSWVFARSLVFDRDLHLANDYALCGDPWHVGLEEGGGRPANPFYLGPALMWAPLLAIVRLVLHAQPGWSPSAVAGCGGPWMQSTLAMAPFAAALTLWIGGRVARRFLDDGVVAMAIVALGLGSTLLHFATLVPAYSHTWASLGVAVGLLGWVRAREADSFGRWLVAGLAVGYAALMRAQGGLLMICLGITLAIELVEALKAKQNAIRPVLKGVLALVGFVAVFSIQLIVYKKLYGHWWVVPQGRSYLQLSHAHPWLVLFAARSGLLTWTPLLWLTVFGFIGMLRSREHRGLAGVLLVALVLDFFINSAPIDWHGNASFGARRLTVLAAPAVLPTAWCLRAFWQWVTKTTRRTAVAIAVFALTPWLVINWGASRGNLDGRVSYNAPVPMPELYGTGLRLGLDAVYSRLGNPFALPATVVFWARYGAGPEVFDRVADGGYFEHDYRPVRMKGTDTINFADATQSATVVEGFVRSPEGITLAANTRGRVLFPLSWPSVTHVTVVGVTTDARTATLPLTLRVGRFWGRRDAATVTLTSTEAEHEVAVMPGAFDSGIVELVFSAPGPVRLRSLKLIDRAAHDTRLF